MTHPEHTVSVGRLAERQRISPKYLEQIMKPLKGVGLVQAVRGVHGGYALSRPPADISLEEVFAALGEAIVPMECLDQPGSCPMEDVCPTQSTWVEIRKSITNVLRETSIQDLADRRRQTATSCAPMYQI